MIKIMKNFLIILVIIVSIIIIIHLPRLIIEIKSKSSHGEDYYQEQKSKNNQRIFTWVSFTLLSEDWQNHVSTIKSKFRSLCRKTFPKNLLSKIIVKDIYEPDSDIMSFEVLGDSRYLYLS